MFRILVLTDSTGSPSDSHKEVQEQHWIVPGSLFAFKLDTQRGKLFRYFNASERKKWVDQDAIREPAAGAPEDKLNICSV